MVPSSKSHNVHTGCKRLLPLRCHARSVRFWTVAFVLCLTTACIKWSGGDSDAASVVNYDESITKIVFVFSGGYSSHKGTGFIGVNDVDKLYLAVAQTISQFVEAQKIDPRVQIHVFLTSHPQGLFSKGSNERDPEKKPVYLEQLNITSQGIEQLYCFESKLSMSPCLQVKRVPFDNRSLQQRLSNLYQDA